MASFGATLKLRLDKAEVEQGLDRVVTSARQVGDKLEGAMGRATTATKKFGRALRPVIDQGLMRLADFAFDQLVEGFKVMAEESKVITEMADALKAAKDEPFKAAGREIDREFGAGTAVSTIKGAGSRVGAVASTGVRTAGDLSDADLRGALRNFQNFLLVAANPFQATVGAGPLARATRDQAESDKAAAALEKIEINTRPTPETAEP